MSTNKKQTAVPLTQALLGKISEIRNNGQLPKTEKQHVTSVPSDSQVSRESEKKKPGRPTLKNKETTEYSRVTASIPKSLRTKLITGFEASSLKGIGGKPIKTMDEAICFALERLVQQEQEKKK